MPSSVTKRALLDHAPAQFKSPWDHADSHEYHNLHTDDIFYVGNEEDQISGHFKSTIDRHFESIAEKWDESPFFTWCPSHLSRAVASPNENVRLRLENANSYFRRKASAVFNDPAALALLESLYEDIVVDISKFNTCEDGIPLAKLTAANFCEVGAKVIHITEAGQRFIDSVRSHGEI